jgi:hypothetical protein
VFPSHGSHAYSSASARQAAGGGTCPVDTRPQPLNPGRGAVHTIVVRRPAETRSHVQHQARLLHRPGPALSGVRAAYGRVPLQAQQARTVSRGRSEGRRRGPCRPRNQGTQG